MYSVKKIFYNCSLPIAFCLFAISSCKQLDVFEKNTPIPKYSWNSNFSANGSFDIKDTASAYKLYLVLRHTDAYKYNNIWLNVSLNTQIDTLFNQKLDIKLADDASGWDGIGMNDIWEIRKPITTLPVKFIKPGTYNYSINQAMRDNPLNNIMSVGIRFEKVHF